MLLRVCERFGIDPTRLEDLDEEVEATLFENESVRIQEDEARFKALLETIVNAVKSMRVR